MLFHLLMNGGIHWGYNQSTDTVDVFFEIRLTTRDIYKTYKTQLNSWDFNYQPPSTGDLSPGFFQPSRSWPFIRGDIFLQGLAAT